MIIIISILKTYLSSKDRESVLRSTFKWGVVLLLYALLIVLQALPRGYGFERTNEYYQYLYQGITILLLFWYLKENSAEFSKNLNYVSILLVVFIYFNGIVGLLQYVLNNSIFYPKLSIDYIVGDANNKRATGFLVSSSNGAGNFGALLFGISLFLFLNKPNMFRFGAIVVNLAFLTLTFTRIGYLSVIIQGLLFLFLASYKYIKKLNYLHLSVINISFLFVIGLLGFLFTSLYNIAFVQRGSTADSRFIQYNFIFEQLIPTLGLKEFFLGIGSGQYINFIANNLNYSDLDIHSQAINTYIETGIIGFILYVLILVLLYVFSLKSLEKKDKWIGHAVFWGYLVCSNFNPNQGYEPVNYLYYFISLYLIIFGGKKYAR